MTSMRWENDFPLAAFGSLASTNFLVKKEKSGALEWSDVVAIVITNAFHRSALDCGVLDLLRFAKDFPPVRYML